MMNLLNVYIPIQYLSTFVTREKFTFYFCNNAHFTKIQEKNKSQG